MIDPWLWWRRQDEFLVQGQAVRVLEEPRELFPGQTGWSAQNGAGPGKGDFLPLSLVGSGI